jgi:hypothetical protein
MELIEIKEGECNAQRKQKRISFPLRGRQFTMGELNTRLMAVEVFGLTNSNGKILVVVDTETGEIIT